MKNLYNKITAYFYKRKCKSFKFVIDPHKNLDRYVVHGGLLYRVQFTACGVSIQDQEDQYVDCQLTRLYVLRSLKND